MKARSTTLVSFAALCLAGISAAALAAQSPDTQAAERRAQMEKCFKAHAKLMSKPALVNRYDCWRIHGYLMEG